MKKWKTNLCLNHSQGSTICKNIKIKCETFQGGSLIVSPPFLAGISALLI